MKIVKSVQWLSTCGGVGLDITCVTELLFLFLFLFQAEVTCTCSRLNISFILNHLPDLIEEEKEEKWFIIYQQANEQ